MEFAAEGAKQAAANSWMATRLQQQYGCNAGKGWRCLYIYAGPLMSCSVRNSALGVGTS